jgi:hypothetical protein
MPARSRAFFLDGYGQLGRALLEGHQRCIVVRGHRETVAHQLGLLDLGRLCRFGRLRVGLGRLGSLWSRFCLCRLVRLGKGLGERLCRRFMAAAFGVDFALALAFTGPAGIAAGFLAAALRLEGARAAATGATGAAGATAAVVGGLRVVVLMAPPWSYRSAFDPMLIYQASEVTLSCVVSRLQDLQVPGRALPRIRLFAQQVRGLRPGFAPAGAQADRNTARAVEVAGHNEVFEIRDHAGHGTTPRPAATPAVAARRSRR